MCVKFNPLVDSEMKAYYVTHALKQGFSIKLMCHNYILEFRNLNSHLLKVYIGAWVKLEIVIENHVC